MLLYCILLSLKKHYLQCLRRYNQELSAKRNRVLLSHSWFYAIFDCLNFVLPFVRFWLKIQENYLNIVNKKQIQTVNNITSGLDHYLLRRDLIVW